jgi:hypothetical protein
MTLAPVTTITSPAATVRSTSMPTASTAVQLSITDMPPSGHVYIDMNVRINSVTMALFTSLSLSPSLCNAFLAVLRSMGYTSVVAVSFIQLSDADRRRATASSVDLRLDLVSSPDYASSLRSVLITSTDLADRVTTQLRQVSPTLGQARVVVMAIYSIRASSDASQSSSGKDSKSDLYIALGVILGVLALAGVIIVIVRGTRKTKPAPIVHEYDHSQLYLELVCVFKEAVDLLTFLGHTLCAKTSSQNVFIRAASLLC